MPDKIINVMTNAPIPETGQEKYQMPFIKDEGAENAPSGGNFTLSNLYKPVKKNAEDIKALGEKNLEQDTRLDALDAYKVTQAEIDTRQDASIEKLEQTKANAITNTRKGSPLVLHDSDDAPVRDLKIYGHTEQRTTEGKNLWNFKNLETVNVAGLDISCKDGVVRIKGNCSYLFNTYDERVGLSFSLPKGDSTFIFGDPIKGKQTNVSLVGYVERADGQVYYSQAERPFLVQTTDIENNFFLQIQPNVDVDVTLYPMLNEGVSLLKEWEPYTGGKPSPSPDYPQPINNAMVQKISDTGKNLLKPSDGSFGDNMAFFCLNPNFKLKKGVTYTFSNKRTQGSLSIIEGNAELKTGYQTASITYTATKDSDVYFRMINNDSRPVAEDNFMLEVSSSATSYEPYKGKIAELSKKYELTKWDRIEKRDGIWGVSVNHRNINPKDLSGWRQEKTWFVTNLPTSDISTDNKAFSNKFRQKDYRLSAEEAEFQIGTNRIVFSGIGVANTISEWEIYVNSHDIFVEIKTDKETWTPLPQEDQAILDSLETFKPTTVMSNDGNTDIEATYNAFTGKMIEQSVEEAKVIVEMGDNYIKYKNGVAECWGMSGSKNISYPFAFEGNASYLDARTLTGSIAITGQTPTGFTTSEATGIYWRAIGKWK